MNGKSIGAVAGALVLALIQVLTSLAASPDGDSVSFTTKDGVQISGRLFEAGKVGVVLGHMYPENQESWWPFAKLLASKGYTALAFDFRGYRESRGTKDISKIDLDMEAAYDFISPKVERVVLIGASMGGTAALKVAARRKVAGVAALSAPDAFKGLDATADIPRITVPKMFVASKDDTWAASSLGFMKSAKEPKQLKIFSGNYHGTYLFGTEHDAELKLLLLGFLSRLK
jgi:uncharacterized protein